MRALRKLRPACLMALVGLMHAGHATEARASQRGCKAKPVQHFVGKAYSDALKPELLRLSRAKDLLIWTPEMIVPAGRGDLSILTVSLTHDIDDPAARIYRIACGNS